MRTIKYRGKMVDGGRWIYGSLLTWPDGEVYILYDKDFATSGMMTKEPVRPETVGQFAGLHDKNGKEIYEGDIIHHGDPNIRYVVEWNDTGLKAKQIGSSSYAGIQHWRGVTTVIGNIHDTPELLIPNS